MCLDENDYPVKPDGTVVTLYFSEWRAKFQERQMQNKLAKAKRDASWQKKDSAPNAQSNVTAPPLPPPAREGHNVFLKKKTGVRACGVDETPRTGSRSSIPFLLVYSDEGRTSTRVLD